MPKRVLDGEGIWRSRKLAAASPEWVRPEYSWIYPICGTNGVFELDPREIWARCYAFNRPDKSVDDVRLILSAMERAKLLFVWEQGGKRLGYWTGSDKQGRLPRESWRRREAKNGKLLPDPPADALRSFLSGEQTAPGPTGHPATEHPTRQERVLSTPPSCNAHTPAVPGSGFGTGSGLWTWSSQVKLTFQKLSDRSWNTADDDLLLSLFKKIEDMYSEATDKTVCWAMNLIAGRSPTKPISFAYFQRSLPGVFNNLGPEVHRWLTQEATRLIQEQGAERETADLAEDLKRLAAASDLPYDSEAAGSAIEHARHRLEKHRELQSELRVGRGATAISVPTQAQAVPSAGNRCDARSPRGDAAPNNEGPLPVLLEHAQMGDERERQLAALRDRGYLSDGPRQRHPGPARTKRAGRADTRATA